MAVIFYYANTVPISNQDLRELTTRIHKNISPSCGAFVQVLFLTARAFALDRAQPSKTCSVPVNLTPRELYVVRKNFSPRCEYL